MSVLGSVEMTHKGADCRHRARSFRGLCSSIACILQVLWCLDTIGVQFVDMPVFVQCQVPRVQVLQNWRSAAARFRTTWGRVLRRVNSSPASLGLGPRRGRFAWQRSWEDDQLFRVLLCEVVQAVLPRKCAQLSCVSTLHGRVETRGEVCVVC